jgi:hypothetical protein
MKSEDLEESDKAGLVKELKHPGMDEKDINSLLSLAERKLRADGITPKTIGHHKINAISGVSLKDQFNGEVVYQALVVAQDIAKELGTIRRPAPKP